MRGPLNYLAFRLADTNARIAELDPQSVNKSEMPFRPVSCHGVGIAFFGERFFKAT